MSHTCGTCHYKRPDGDGYQCCAVPPATMAVTLPKPDLSTGMMTVEVVFYSRFPRIELEWWCGNYRPAGPMVMS